MMSMSDENILRIRKKLHPVSKSEGKYLQRGRHSDLFHCIDFDTNHRWFLIVGT